MFAFLRQRHKQRHLNQIQAVLFDLDGTLLQVAMNRYIPEYIDGIGQHLQDLVDPRLFARTARHAVQRLFTDPDNAQTNEQQFLAGIEQGTGVEPDVYRQRLNHYLADGVKDLASMIEPIPQSRAIIETCRAKGLKVVLATNPVFPRTLVDARLEAAGLRSLAFEAVTSYENSRFCKPDARYYEEVASQIGVQPEHCLMVGNDTEFDLGAADAGMITYLVDTYLEDRLDGQWRADFQGDHDQLHGFVQQLTAAREN